MCQPPLATVLIVHDQRPLPADLIGPLQHSGLVIRQAAGQEDLASQFAGADLIVLQSGPGILNLCQRLEAEPATADRPLLYLVTPGDAGQDPETPSAADLVLVAPVQPAEFLAAVNVLLRLRKAEEKMLRTHEEERLDRLEAVGRLAGGVAHDFNNLLTVVNGYSELLLEDEWLNEMVRDSLQAIRKAGDRAAQLTRQLLAFSRKQVLTPRAFDLNDAVADVQVQLRRILGDDVEVTFVAGQLAGPVLADPGLVEEVLTQLALYARDGMPQGGQFTLATSLLEVAATSRDPEGLPAGSYAVLRLWDTGRGLSPAAQARLFEPFFSTRELGHGEGIGLAVVHGIVHQSGGRIEVQSQLGEGTTFTIVLPRAGETVSPPAAASGPVASERPITILMVEDEPPVRSLVRTVLQREGYQVLEAAEPWEAERLCRTLQGRIDLLLTDMVMPAADGRRLAERLSEMRPDMKVLLMSGFLEGELPRSAAGGQRVAFLPKPFTREALAHKVREVLGMG
jgi:signal transduction histidine kinase